LKQKKVLLVDDIGLFLAMETEYLRREHCQLFTARSGNEALEVARREIPDLIFMDLFMPDGNGDDTCLQMKADPQLQHIPVVIITNSQDEEDLERCRNAGCDDILNKPIDRNIFLATAYRFLNLKDEDSERIKIRLDVCYGPDPEQMVQRHSFDLSTGGMFIETDRLLRRDTQIHMEFKLRDNASPITCRARVAWANHRDWMQKTDLPPGMAIQFLDLPLISREEIKEYIRRSKR